MSLISQSECEPFSSFAGRKVPHRGKKTSSFGEGAAQNNYRDTWAHGLIVHFSRSSKGNTTPTTERRFLSTMLQKVGSTSDT